MSEKRNEKRVEEMLTVSYTSAEGGWVSYEAASENLSHKGMKIRIAQKSAHELTKGQHVRLQFQVLGDAIPFDVNAKVVWIKDEDGGRSSVGIMFSSLDPMQRERIEKYLKRKD